MCERTIRMSLAPIIRAASTNSFSRSDSMTAHDARRVEPAETRKRATSVRPLGKKPSVILFRRVADRRCDGDDEEQDTGTPS